mmetsp:Transcript_34088/g.87169  ORF Transcript_34088/g.87169 Transcript_34088/m.87169 type:complete len:412 (+) Transcript_34088:286-1521(+)
MNAGGGVSVRGAPRLELATVLDGDLLGGGAALAANALDRLHHVHALHHLAKHDVLAVQPGRLSSAQEELRAISAGPRVGHGEDARAGVLELKVLVFKLLAIDGLAAGSVARGEVAALAHESGDDAVELGSLEAKARLASAQRAEVLRRLGRHVAPQLELNPPRILAADLHVEEALERLVVLDVQARDVHHLNLKVEGLTGEGVVGVDGDLGVGDLGDGGRQALAQHHLGARLGLALTHRLHHLLLRDGQHILLVHLAVGVFWGQLHALGLALGQAHDALVEAGDHLAGAHGEGQRRAARPRGVKLLAGLQRADVVDGHLIALLNYQIPGGGADKGATRRTGGRRAPRQLLQGLASESPGARGQLRPPGGSAAGGGGVYSGEAAAARGRGGGGAALHQRASHRAAQAHLGGE